jgi:hypothetical protein
MAASIDSAMCRRSGKNAFSESSVFAAEGYPWMVYFMGNTFYVL